MQRLIDKGSNRNVAVVKGVDDLWSLVSFTNLLRLLRLLKLEQDHYQGRENGKANDGE